MVFFITHTSPGMILQVSSIDHGPVENETPKKNLVKGNRFFWGTSGFFRSHLPDKKNIQLFAVSGGFLNYLPFFAILPLKN